MVPERDFLCACHLDVKVSKQAMYIVSSFDVYSVSVVENFFFFHKSLLKLLFLFQRQKFHFAQGEA